MLNAAEEQIQLPEREAPLQPLAMVNLPDPALDNLIESLSYESLLKLAATSKKLRDRLKARNTLPTKLKEYWQHPLKFTRMVSKKTHVLGTDINAPYRFIGDPFAFAQRVNSVAFSPRDKYIVTRNTRSQFILWQLQNPSLIEFEGQPSYIKKAVQIRELLFGGVEPAEAGFSSHSVSFSPDETMVAGAVGHTIFLWDTQSGTIKGQFQDKEIINSIAFWPDGKTLIYQSGIVPFSIKLLNLDDGEIIGESQGLSFALSPDGNTLAFTPQFDEIILWNIRGKEIIERFKTRYRITSLEFSPDSRILAWGSAQGTISLWDLKTNARTIVQAHQEGTISDLTFSRYGAVLASASLREKKIKLYRINTGKQITIEQINSMDGFGPIAFSRSGLLLAAKDENGEMGLWQQPQK